MPSEFRHPNLSNVWKAQTRLSSLKKRWWVERGEKKHVEKAVYWQAWERFRAKPHTDYSEKPGPGVFRSVEN